MPHLADHRHVSALALAAVMTLMACQAEAAAPAAPSAAPGAVSAGPGAASTSSDVQNLLANARAALRQHDQRTFQGFRAQLTSRLGEQPLRDAHLKYRLLLGDLVAAGDAHDAMARARFVAALRALCEGDRIVGALEPCDADLAAFAGG